MSNILDLIGNGQTLTLPASHYAAILGESPSKGARSPVLWNKAFEQLGVDARMVPMDVAPESLPAVVDALRADTRYLGGAVAVPYKTALLPLLDEVDVEAQAIGAINCIYRKQEKLVGTNTDGAGALYSLLQALPQEGLHGKRVALIGVGGAGLAVAAFVAKAMGQSGQLVLCNRSELSPIFVDTLRQWCAITTVAFPLTADELNSVDILINCSSIGYEGVRHDDDGYYSLMAYSPLSSHLPKARVSDLGENWLKEFVALEDKNISENWLDSIRLLSGSNLKLVFDIVYQPLQSQLLAIANNLGIPTLNGLPMNMEQAVIAFCKTVESAQLAKPDQDTVRAYMQMA